MFKYNGEDYIFGGTKTVHRVGKLNDGFEQFDNDTNELCKSVFKSFYDYWNRFELFSKEILKSKLISGYTACGEFEDGKHMIPLPMGENARLAMFGLIENVGSVNNKVDICEEVSEAINFYKSAEFNTVDINILRSLNGKSNF
ncbi:hypothetical protein MHBO_000591 [Bonamia ostreae]|uniref:Uncharacterized protein n=1 Tax=Bonamia ostreae TaxID=126728 RepID=A0ABV2AGB9_9EUKA